MNQEKEKEPEQKLTDEQLWELCSKEEVTFKQKRDYYSDKGVDYEYEQVIWDKWNPKQWK